MGFKASGLQIHGTKVYFGLSSDQYIGYPKITDGLLFLEDSKEWKYYDSISNIWKNYYGLNESKTISEIVIFNAITIPSAMPYTIDLLNKDIKEIKISTSGTSTSRTLTFKAKLLNGDGYKAWTGLNWSDGSATLATQTTGKDEIWIFSGFDGLDSIQFNVSAIAGGNFSVVATLLD